MSAKAILSASVSAAPIYVEDVFSTFLYTGTGAAQTITNGIDLSGKGGLVWLKGRNDAGGSSAYGGSNSSHLLFDTARGMSHAAYSYSLRSNGTNGQSNFGNGGVNAISTGFDIGFNGYNDINYSGNTYCSWTFREAAKFFDVVTYTGNGSSQTIAHNLGSVPGCIIVKRTNASSDWAVYHRSLATNEWLLLNDTSAKVPNGNIWNNTAPTSTVFSVGSDGTSNFNGQPFVAYLFAHDAGGFGTAGTDNVVSCGTFTTPSVGGVVDVNLGWEAQWVLFKSSSNTGAWYILDNMRGWPVGSADQLLSPNSSNAEVSVDFGHPTATGFTTAGLNSSQTYIYIAIRRGPMKTPTVGTEVFSANAVNVSAGVKITTGFPVDWQINYYRSVAANYNSINFNRLTGVSSNSTNSGQCLWTAKTDAEATFAGTLGWDNTGYQQTGNLWPNIDNIYWNFRRAPGFFDVVAYTGTSASITVNHNLGVTPELIIGKCRTAAFNWIVYHQFLGTGAYISLNTSDDRTLSSLVSAVSPTSFTGEANAMSYSGNTHIAYLFATAPGVSKVGSYTGTGTTKQIDCGFTAGARLVLIKRTDSTGSWYVWDTARGIVSADDPYLLLNSTAAEVTNTDYIDPLASGFEISSTAPAEINANGGSYIFLAVA